MTDQNTSRPMTPLMQQIIAQRREGLTNNEIALRLGCKKAWVSQVLARAGLPAVRQANEHRNKVCMDGANLSDPNRADKLLRRFSWEQAA